MSVENLEKLNFTTQLLQSENVSIPSNGNTVSSPYDNQGGLKRRRTEDYSDVCIYHPSKLSNYVCFESKSCISGRTFLSIRHNACVYHTEDWKPRGCTMYLPLSEDIMINTRNIEQISFESDQFFLADEKGNYVGAKQGNAVHLWRFDASAKKLYISRSVLFLKEQDYQDFQIQLENL